MFLSKYLLQVALNDIT